ncbi:hypothetical protein K2173_027849 [Erythroxylum novogranatense]|uniref:Jasmonate O-methyltransferase n=1 Tax=Erythroxylum novogranatense TaxID=1862640 RepID=A0AAV8U042_9ROSI|nr:hypothetical protein K2173_027849 [Erythroxylum novogranatense]
MEVTLEFHMNKGVGETSYAKNCAVQNKIISVAKPVMDESVKEMLSSTGIPASITIADLGCSSGPNSLSVISQIIDFVFAHCKYLSHRVPEFTVFLNDLPCNDFNTIFGLLPQFYTQLKEEKGDKFGPCFVSAMPGSFYGRLFSTRSLHFVHSSSSLHWLSQVPPGLDVEASRNMNKGKIYISKSSPQCVLDAYALQFRKDFSMFLRSRSEEIVPGGCMVLSFLGRSSTDPASADACYQWELLAEALMALVAEGHLDEEKVDSFNAPYYAPSVEELKMEFEKEGSFIISHEETFDVEWDAGVVEGMYTKSRGQKVTKTIRAVVESMLESHFGTEIMDELFVKYEKLVGDYLSSKFATKYHNMVISLVKK